MCGIVAIPLYTKRCCVLIPSLEATTPIYKATMYADTVTLSIYLLVDRAIGSGSLADGSLADGRGLLMSSPASFHAFSLSIHLPKHQQLPFMPFLCQYTHQSTNSFPSRLLFVITLTKTPTASIHAFSLSIHSPKHQQLPFTPSLCQYTHQNTNKTYTGSGSLADGRGLLMNSPAPFRPSTDEVRAQLLGVLLFTDLQVSLLERKHGGTRLCVSCT